MQEVKYAKTRNSITFYTSEEILETILSYLKQKLEMEQIKETGEDEGLDHNFFTFFFKAFKNFLIKENRSDLVTILENMKKKKGIFLFLKGKNKKKELKDLGKREFEEILKQEDNPQCLSRQHLIWFLESQYLQDYLQTNKKIEKRQQKQDDCQRLLKRIRANGIAKQPLRKMTKKHQKFQISQQFQDQYFKQTSSVKQFIEQDEKSIQGVDERISENQWSFSLIYKDQSEENLPNQFFGRFK